jgi:hypothetical protein
LAEDQTLGVDLLVPSYGSCLVLTVMVCKCQPLSVVSPAPAGLADRVEETVEADHEADGSKEPAPSCSMSLETVYYSVAKAYPMAATALLGVTCNSSGKQYGIVVLTRAHSYSRWLISAQSGLKVTRPTPGNAAPTVAEDQAAAKAVTAVLDYLQSGSSTVVKASQELARFHTEVRNAPDCSTRAVTARILDNADKQGTYRTAKTSTGTLVTASYVVTVTTIGVRYDLKFPSPLDQVLGQPGYRPSLKEHLGMVMTMLIDAEGITIVGFQHGQIL